LTCRMKNKRNTEGKPVNHSAHTNRKAAAGRYGLRLLAADHLSTTGSYDRTAWAGTEDPALRITFDRNIRWRRDRLTLDAGDDGKRLLPEDQILMEVKTLGACPLWLCRALSAQHIYPASFSKYGACYKEMCREANAPTRMTNSKEAHRCA